MTFDVPWMLWGAPAAGVAVLALAWWARQARLRHAGRWSPALRALAGRSGRLSPLMLATAAVMAALALAGPRWGTRVVAAESKALNLVIAVDISRSMLAEDVEPSRLERAKLQARRLVHDLPNDRVGLIAFSGQSYILSPLTVDGAALQLWLDALDPAIASAGGTELAPVLRQGRELLFATSDVADRVLVVFTDGEGHDSLPGALAAAERLRRDGVRLILVGEGGRDPARIPVRDDAGNLLGYQRDPSDEIVETVRRDDVLAAMADAARGMLVPADLDDQAGAVRELVADFQRAPQSATTTAGDVSRAWIPALFATVTLLVHTMTRRTAALAALALLLGAPRAGAQGPTNPGDEAWMRGELRAAAEHYLAQVRAGHGGDTTWFNLGTAAMAVGDTGLARRALERAAESPDAELRFRGLYNLGLLALQLAQNDSAGRTAHLDEAVRRYREALLLNPGDVNAKWNLELALRQQPPPNQNAPQSGAGGGSEPPPPPGPPPGLTPAQAEQLLNSMAEAERQTRREQLRRRRQAMESRGQREW